MAKREDSRRFWRISAAGICFQGGAAAVDSSTIIASLVYGLTGSTYAVGAAAAILRYGWLAPQLFVAYFAQRSKRRMPFYAVGAFGRTACLLGIVVLLSVATARPTALVVGSFFGLWILYSLVSGIVAVPYNDIVARSVLSERRSRLLAIRFFGGGLLVLGIAGAARHFLEAYTFPAGHAAIVFMAALLLLTSSVSFVSAGEPATPRRQSDYDNFTNFIRQGAEVFQSDLRFRLFVYSQWLGGAVTMALPFYILEAAAARITAADVAVLLGAQTTGALVSNALWGWWGDRHGKRNLLEGVAVLRVVPPLLVLLWPSVFAVTAVPSIAWFAGVFLALGALGNGITIAMLGYLMEISPDDRRPAYSGYFNALVAPAALLPVAGAAIAEVVSLPTVFAVSLVAAILQFLLVRVMKGIPQGRMSL